MARESREVWTKRVERWRDSGLSAAEFAAEVGVNANSLRHWGSRLNRERRSEAAATATAAAAPLTFVEVAAPTADAAMPAPTSSGEKLELVVASGMVVRVPTCFEPAALRRLLTVVG